MSTEPVRALITTSLADAAPMAAHQVTSNTGLPLFAGALHALVGPSEVGKSTLAGHCVLDVANAGRGVLLLDGEMSAPAWRYRLQQLDAGRGALDRIRYAEMTQHAADPDRVRAAIATHDVALVVWDSALSLIARTARSENDNAEIGRLFDRLRAIVRDGPAGLVVDHTGREAGQMVSRGASAKFAALDVSYGVRLAEGAVPGPLEPWSSIVSVEKDRHGLLPGRGDREVTFAPLNAGRGIVVEVATLSGATHRLSPASPIARLVARIRELDPPPASANEAYKRLGGTRKEVLGAYRRWRELGSGSGGSSPYGTNHRTTPRRTSSEPPEPPGFAGISPPLAARRPNHPPPNHPDDGTAPAADDPREPECPPTIARAHARREGTNQ